MSDSLTIGRFVVTGLAAAGLGERDRYQQAIERIDSRQLARSLSARLGRIASDDLRVLVLDRLTLDLDSADLGDTDRICTILAEGIAAALDKLRQGASFTRSCSFTSPAHRRAALVLARARGQAADRWWLADRQGLANLPLSSAIRTVLVEVPQHCSNVLGLLESADRLAVVAKLSAVDTDLALDAAIAALGEGNGAEWRAVFDLDLPAQLAGDKAMLFTLGGLAGAGLHPGAEVQGAIRTALALRRAAVRSGRRVTLFALWAVLGRGMPSRETPPWLEAVVADLAIEDIQGLIALPEAMVSELDLVLAARPEPVAAANHAGFSRFGGLLMLCPLLPPLPAEALPKGPGDPSMLATFLAVCALAGKQSSADMMSDDMLRAVFGVAPQATAADLANWLAQVEPGRMGFGRATLPHDAGLPREFIRLAKQHRWLLGYALAGAERFARGLAGFGKSSLPFLRENLLGAGAQIAIGADGVAVTLERPSLDVLLTISGFGDGEHRLADGRFLQLDRRR